MLPTKFWLIWPSDFRGEDLKLEAQVSLYRSNSLKNEKKRDTTKKTKTIQNKKHEII
jgi:hypothetical protein